MGDVDTAYARCDSIARSHYENFPVASYLVPASMRKALTAVYAFARLGDDAADEPWTTSAQERLEKLDALEKGLTEPSDIDIMPAVQDTISAYGLPLAPFQRLLHAFRLDVRFERPSTWQDVLDYCSYSANPVGELVLRLDHGGMEPSEDALRASDAVCTALQITNFLQDISVDLERGRNYLPVSDAEAISRTRELFARGRAVIPHARHLRMRLELRAIILGGSLMLDLCEQRTNRHERPVLNAQSIWRIFVGRAKRQRNTE